LYYFELAVCFDWRTAHAQSTAEWRISDGRARCGGLLCAYGRRTIVCVVRASNRGRAPFHVRRGITFRDTCTIAELLARVANYFLVSFLT